MLSFGIVSIHAPWEGCDWSVLSVPSKRTEFQFTHPGKGATPRASSAFSLDTFQFTHPGKGATALRPSAPIMYHPFQFTHPGKGATQSWICSCNLVSVSIHAPWEGCDVVRPTKSCYLFGFNSRTLGRVRRKDATDGSVSKEFQFTHPGKGATVAKDEAGRNKRVSIHAPWEGCDCWC